MATSLAPMLTSLLPTSSAAGRHTTPGLNCSLKCTARAEAKVQGTGPCCSVHQYHSGMSLKGSPDAQPCANGKSCCFSAYDQHACSRAAAQWHSVSMIPSARVCICIPNALFPTESVMPPTGSSRPSSAARPSSAMHPTERFTPIVEEPSGFSAGGSSMHGRPGVKPPVPGAAGSRGAAVQAGYAGTPDAMGRFGPASSTIGQVGQHHFDMLEIHHWLMWIGW